jgi:alpha-methylacyl-CoA racemase
VCFAPVLAMDEVADDPHLGPRGVVADLAGLRQPMPAPRFDRTPAATPLPQPSVGQHADELLHGLGLSDSHIGRLRADGVVS